MSLKTKLSKSNVFAKGAVGSRSGTARAESQALWSRRGANLVRSFAIQLEPVRAGSPLPRYSRFREYKLTCKTYNL